MGFFEKIKKGLGKTKDNMSIKMNNLLKFTQAVMTTRSQRMKLLNG